MSRRSSRSRTHRRNRGRFGPLFKLLCVLAVVVALTGGATVFFRVETVEVTGNQRYTQEEIIDRIFPGKADRNVIYCYGKDRLKEHIQIPFVEDYQLVFHGPFHVEVIVHEKSVVGYVSYMSSYMYFDKDGIIVESANKEIDGIPRVVGLNYGQIVIHQPLPVEDEGIFKDILNLTQVLSLHDLDVDRIQFDARGETTLYMDDLEVFLGNNENIDGKILRLSNMFPQLDGLSGTLYLDTYDPANSSMAYTFKRKS